MPKKDKVYCKLCKAEIGDASADTSKERAAHLKNHDAINENDPKSIFGIR